MTVRPSAPRGHQYEVALSARNRMLTRVVAKQAKTTKVKNKQRVQTILSCLFGERRKVQFRR